MTNRLPPATANHLREIVRRLRNRRGLYISDSFDALVAFITGYSEAIKQSTGVDLMALLQEYVKSSNGAEFSILWPYYLAHEVANEDTIYATELVLATLDDFTSKHTPQDTLQK